MTDDHFWHGTPAVPPLGAGEVHVWRADLAALGGWLAYCAAVLDADERARAARFYFPRDGERFTLAHGVLRLLLSRYLGASPAELRFTLGPRGKPSLAGAPAQAELHFNLSHSHQLALLAVTRAAAVGVDVERIRPDLPWQKMARRVLCPREQEWLAQLPDEVGPARFFDLWVAKEAYAKALGAGLSLPVAAVAVDLSSAPDINLADAAHVTPLAGWSGRLLAPGQGYAGAVVHPVGVAIRCWQVSAELFS